MTSLLQRTRSVWMDDCPAPAPELPARVQADIVVIGAGIGGLTTAYLLAREGRHVVVVDSGTPGGGMTGRTTAHLSCALDDRWYKLISLRGEEDARIAADAHRGAINLIDSIARSSDRTCDFARVDGYLVAATEDDIEQLHRELDAAHRVGLAGVVLNEGGPFDAWATSPCLCFPNQARLHPLKYLGALIADIKRHGGELYTGHAVSMEDKEDEGVSITFRDNRKIRARSVVVATNTPINDRVMVHTKQAPYRTYAIASHVPKGSVPDALLWDTGWPYHYVRIQPAANQDILIVGGEDHKSGQAFNMDERVQRLEEWARARFPIIDVNWKWSGQVMEPVDCLGYLGRNPGDENIYIITGDSGQGMTHATIGAMIIADQVAGRANPCAQLFDPGRITLKAGAAYARENLNVAVQMADHVTAGDVDSVEDIPPGSGAIVRRGAHKIAVYRAADNVITAHSAVCPHVGCVVAWNPMEKCWDCPCHGSQFSTDGKVMNGPATSDLEPADYPEPVERRPSKSTTPRREDQPRKH